MRRRELLHGLFALSAAGVLNGCRESEKSDHDDSHREPKNPATLKVVLQGPFAVVLKKKEDRYTVSAFIPPDSAHEFRFQQPTPEGRQTSFPKYQFTLEDKGLDVNSRRRPYIDHGFDDVFFDLGEYPQPDAFVAVDLPAPDVITFIPPPEPVVFQGGRVALAPLNHVLEYKIRDLPKVLLHSKQLGDQPPLAFTKIFDGYQEHGKNEKEYTDKKGHGPQFPHTKDELGRPAEPEVYTYFFGVGIPPETFKDADAVFHALTFFNQKLLPLFPNAKNLKPLIEIRNYGDFCTPAGKTAPSRLNPAVLRNSIQPRLLLVSSAEDCRGVTLSGCSGC